MKTLNVALSNLSERINYALHITGTKKADLARAISVKPQVIQFLCNSQTQTSRFTFEIATVLGLNIRWLATGEGAIFIADDPKQQFLKSYASIPLLNDMNIRDYYLNKNSNWFDSIEIWLPLRTDEPNTFAITMPDTSMEPVFPVNSHIFIKECRNKTLGDQKYVLAYLVKFDTFVIREITEIDSEFFLTPKNKDLFKEVKITDDIQFIGLVTDCFWHVRG